MQKAARPENGSNSVSLDSSFRVHDDGSRQFPDQFCSVVHRLDDSVAIQFMHVAAFIVSIRHAEDMATRRARSLGIVQGIPA